MDDSHTETCCVCGIKFCMSKEHSDMLRRTKRTFYCPSGHGQSYMGETYKQKLENLEIIVKEKPESAWNLWNKSETPE